MRGIPRRFPSADKGGDTPAGIPEKSQKNPAQLPRKSRKKCRRMAHMEHTGTKCEICIINGRCMCAFDRLALNWAVFTFSANLHAHFLQLNRLFRPSERPLDSVWTSNVSRYQRRETTGSSSCWPHVHITVTSALARLETLLVWLEMKQEYGFCVNIQTEPTSASGEHENTQTRLLVRRPITGRITATGDTGRGVCLVGLANRSRTTCIERFALFTDHL